MICKQLTCLLPNLRGPTEGSPIVGLWQICWMNEQMEPRIYLVLHFSYLPFMASVFALMTFYFFLCLFPKKFFLKQNLFFLNFWTNLSLISISHVWLKFDSAWAFSQLDVISSLWATAYILMIWIVISINDNVKNKKNSKVMGRTLKNNNNRRV